jgi:acetyl/propionyl-CoA carboxylase alpha subunit
VEVGLFYDPLLGKLIVHAPDRDGALERMSRALAELRIVGVETSAPFHRRVMQEPDFRAGTVTIRYLEEHPDLLDGGLPEDVVRSAAVAAALLEDASRARRGTTRAAPPAHAASAWRERGWR